ncbi:sulfatase-like hydrolase/transferase [Pontiella sulfatireligans]
MPGWYGALRRKPYCPASVKRSANKNYFKPHKENDHESKNCHPHLLMEAGYHAGLTGKGWGPGSYATEHNPAGPSFDKIKLKPPFKGIKTIDYAANFAAFLDGKPAGEPFCFWLGTYEPHRGYEKDSWKKEGMKLEDAIVPPFFPDNDTVRGDLLDYALEVQWFDRHLGLAVEALEERGLLDNTLIIATSDHGMPFPRIKGQLYDEGFHVPMIAYWKGVIRMRLFGHRIDRITQRCFRGMTSSGQASNRLLRIDSSSAKP